MSFSAMLVAAGTTALIFRSIESSLWNLAKGFVSDKVGRQAHFHQTAMIQESVSLPGTEYLGPLKSGGMFRETSGQLSTGRVVVGKH